MALRISGIADQEGLSLLEVMIAVAVFSIGLLGTAGMLITAARANQSAYLRTQATFLANNMAERMRANPIGVWNDAYNGTDYPERTRPPECGSGQSCSPAEVARRDRSLWSDMLRSHLPGVAGSIIHCDKSGVGLDPRERLARRPPYGGHCAMQISWAEKGLTSPQDSAQGRGLRSFSWRFQP